MRCARLHALGTAAGKPPVSIQDLLPVRNGTCTKNYTWTECFLCSVRVAVFPGKTPFSRGLFATSPRSKKPIGLASDRLDDAQSHSALRTASIGSSCLKAHGRELTAVSFLCLIARSLLQSPAICQRQSPAFQLSAVRCTQANLTGSFRTWSPPLSSLASSSFGWFPTSPTPRSGSNQSGALLSPLDCRCWARAAGIRPHCRLSFKRLSP